VGEFVFLLLGAEVEFVHMVDDLAEVVAALDLVADLPEDFADLVFDGVRSAGALFETVEVRKELLVDVVPEVITRESLVMVDLTTAGFRSRPFPPAVVRIENIGVFFPLQLSLRGFIGFERIEVFQEQQPRALFRVIQLTGASGIFVQDVVDIFKGLFKHVYARG
jgi:hypothetical protein